MVLRNWPMRARTLGRRGPRDAMFVGMRLKRPVLIVLMTLGLGYVAIVAAAFIFQRALIFPAPATAREPRQGLVRGQGFVAMHFPGTPTIVHFHGNAEQLADS